MTLGAALFMAGSWLFVLSLMGWSYARVLRPKPKPSAKLPAAEPAEKPTRRNGRPRR